MKAFYVTGATGFLGKNLLRALPRNAKVYRQSSSECDLRVQLPDIPPDVTHVIHCAAEVGGIRYNMENPATTFLSNTSMLLNVLSGIPNTVKHVTLVGSACAYPLYAPVPSRESDLWMGLPEPSNGPYGIAKRLMSVVAGLPLIFKVWNPILTNMYGPHDNFSETGHVIPQVMRRMSEAKENRLPSITLMGDGSPTRDFLYVQDAARYIVAGIRLDMEGVTNIGGNEEVSILGLARMIAQVVNYEGEIVWGDKSMNGQPRRLLDTSKIDSAIPLTRTPLYMGLMQTHAWWRQNG